MKTVTERVHLRILVCQSCHNQTCWINQRLPTYCHECGQLAIGEKKPWVLISDDSAIIKYKEKKP